MNDAYDPLTGFIHCTNGGIIRLSGVVRLILMAFLQSNGRPLTFEFLFNAAWGHLPDADYPEDELGALRVHIHNLAKKLLGCSAHIESLWGVGYRMVGKFDVMKPAAGNCPCCGRPMPDNPALTN